MSKKLRRITVLALIPVLVCLLSITAFATAPFPYTASYDGGSQYIEADANISRYSTNGIITSIAYGNDLYAHVTYKYYPAGGASLVSETDSNTSNRYYVEVGFSNSSIFAMYNATYTFRANVYTSYGPQVFNPNVTTIAY